MIRFRCSNCNHQVGVPEKYAGRRVRCASCNGVTEVPESAGKTDVGRKDVIKFRCSKCNLKIGVSSVYAGRRVRCAKCENPLLVPQASSQGDAAAAKDELDVLRVGQEGQFGDEKAMGDLDMYKVLAEVESSLPTEELQEQSPVDPEVGQGESLAETEELPPLKLKEDVEDEIGGD